MRIVLTSILCLFLLNVFSQDEDSYGGNSVFDFVLQKNDPVYLSELNVPIIGVNLGILSFHGDVDSKFSKNFATGMPAFQIDYQQLLSPNYSVGIKYLRGKLYGTEYIPKTNIQFNFQSQVSTYGAFVKYNFANNHKLPIYHLRKLSPYITVGMEVMQSPEPWGDFYNDTIQLHQWSDGSLRDIPEDPTMVSKSTVYYRDYKYETALYEENIDNIDSYSPLIVALPLEFGASLRLDPRVQLNFGYQYHICFSDQLDNISTAGKDYSETPQRKGNSLPDGYSFAYVSLSIDISKKVDDSYENDSIGNEDSEQLAFWDADGDGVDETKDECPYTPKGVEVTGNGCPIDLDNDRIPDYKDIEAQTKGFYISPEGKGFTEKEMLEMMYAERGIPQAEIYRFYPNLLNGGTVYKQFYKKIPSKFKDIDKDKNQYIDIDELLYAIDSFFDEGPDAGAGSNLAVKDLFDLIEFFFLQ